MISQSSPAWIAIYTEPRAEVRAMREVIGLGFAAYCPVERFFRVYRGKREMVSRPLFPRYIFAAFDPHKADWGAINHADGVVSVLGHAGKASRVPTVWIDGVRRAEGMGVFDRTTKNPAGLKIGQNLKIGKGPFVGMQATVAEFVGRLRSSRSKKRVKVLMDLLGRATTLEFDVADLDLV